MITTPATVIVQGGGQRAALIAFLGWLGIWLFFFLGAPPDRSLPVLWLQPAGAGLPSAHQNPGCGSTTVTQAAGSLSTLWPVHFQDHGLRPSPGCIVWGRLGSGDIVSLFNLEGVSV